MSFFWGDGFDCYALPADALLGYWDSGTAVFTLVTGRFSGSRAFTSNSGGATSGVLVKSSGSNDALHHIVVAFQQVVAIGSTTNYQWFTFSDGATAQCSIVFRLDGSIILTSGASNGTVLATYSNAFTAANTWYAFEFEVLISNTAGYMNVRKNGNTSNDFASATNLNTRAGTANNYANRLTLGCTTGANNQYIDDLLWRSDAASVPWVGDIRCFTRRPASDAAVQWTPSGSAVPLTPVTQTTTISSNTTTPRYTLFTAPATGTVATVTVPIAAAYTGNMKCTIFAGTSAGPTTILGSATPISAPAIGTATFTFPTPVSVTQGIQYWVGFMWDTAGSSNMGAAASSVSGANLTGTTSYAAFPAASPVVTIPATAIAATIQITPATGAVNSAFVADLYQDAAASYVFSSTVGQTDQYTLTGTASVPTTVVGVTTRGLFQKSDAGTRNAVVQLKSGGTTVESASTALNTTWGWIARTDLTDPASGVAWTPGGVSTAQVGARVAA